MYIQFVIAYNTSVAKATEEKVMARSQQSGSSKVANKASKSTNTKSATKSSTKNCSNCTNCK